MGEVDGQCSQQRNMPKGAVLEGILGIVPLAVEYIPDWDAPQAQVVAEEEGHCQVRTALVKVQDEGGPVDQREGCIPWLGSKHLQPNRPHLHQGIVQSPNGGESGQPLRDLLALGPFDCPGRLALGLGLCPCAEEEGALGLCPLLLVHRCELLLCVPDPEAQVGADLR
eukprot:8809076-Lingulodinium_polyedra.AAC.1